MAADVQRMHHRVPGEDHHMPQQDQHLRMSTSSKALPMDPMSMLYIQSLRLEKVVDRQALELRPERKGFF
jgi:hypothetical protein